MKHIARAALALSLLSTVILGACSDGPVGIFESLSLETPIDNGTAAFERSTPNFVVRFGTDYYAGVGALWKRAASGGAWNKVAGAPSGLYAVSAATDGTDLWALFTDGATHSVKVWDGSAWGTDLVTTDIGATKPDVLYYRTATLFLAVASTDTLADPDVTTANIHSGAGFATAAFGTSPPGGTVKALVHDGLTYYSAHADKVYSGDAGAGGLTAMAQQPAIGTVTTLLARGADDVVASGSSGSIAVWNGTAWAGHVIDSTAYLSDLVEVPANGSGTVLLAASRADGTKAARGYFEVNPTTFAIVTDRGLVSSSTNFQTTLEGKSVMKFYYDGDVAARTAGRLFALTGGDGLWSNAWTGTAWSGWNRE